ncbi:hypothetical protein [Streptomyces sp. NPDC058869]|uniref:hypothetical protein n=1 Tax=Streptomyces sp. NPDC058869 TaxID=3346659 RepID=UPI0036AF4C97
MARPSWPEWLRVRRLARCGYCARPFSMRAMVLPARGRGAVADALAEVGPVDRVGGGADVGLDDALAAPGVRAPVVVLLAVLADAAAVAPGLDGVDVLVALGAPRQRPGAQVGHPDAGVGEHDVDAVAPLGGVLVVLAADMGGGDGDDLAVVAEEFDALSPPLEKPPVGGELGDVLAEDGLVVVDLGGPHDVVGGGAGTNEAFRVGGLVVVPDADLTILGDAAGSSGGADH